jgi:hypothetical protein
MPVELYAVEVPAAPDKTNRFATFREGGYYGGIGDIVFVEMRKGVSKPQSICYQICDDLREAAASGVSHAYFGSARVNRYHPDTRRWEFGMTTLWALTWLGWMWNLFDRTRKDLCLTAKIYVLPAPYYGIVRPGEPGDTARAVRQSAVSCVLIILGVPTTSSREPSTTSPHQNFVICEVFPSVRGNWRAMHRTLLSR